MGRGDSLKYQVRQALAEQFKAGIGQKKGIDKKTEDKTEGKIYMDSTYQAYYNADVYFTNYCKEHHRCHTLEECHDYINEYLQYRSDYLKKNGDNLSTWTIKLDANAIAKMYREHSTDYMKTRDRKRADIKRSRGPVKYDQNFSEKKHKDFVDFCKSIGLRNNKELRVLRGTDLVELGNGKYAVMVNKGKGGKERLAPIVGPEERVAATVAKMKEAGGERVWERIFAAADIHSYRADYCCYIYEQHARDPHKIPISERYMCRNDLKGVWYDKKAMLIASEALGHERLEVIAGHYLWQLGR